MNAQFRSNKIVRVVITAWVILCVLTASTADGANAVTTALSPDGSTLLVLTSGFNNGFSKDDGTSLVYPILDATTGQPTGQTTSNAEWVFIYDVTGPVPVQKRKINLPITYNGLVWNSKGSRFYVSGGANDVVYPLKKVNAAFQLDAPFMVLNNHEPWITEA